MVRIRYTSRQVIMAALDATNAQFENNIEFNRFDAVGNYYEVTIKVKSSRGAGAKTGMTGRRTSTACWHVWGTFFDEIFMLSHDDAIIWHSGITITSMETIISMGTRMPATNVANWATDRNVGDGRRESEMCECGKPNSKWIAQSSLTARRQSVGRDPHSTTCYHRDSDQTYVNDAQTICLDCEATHQLSCLCFGQNGVPDDCDTYNARRAIDYSQYIPTPTVMPELNKHQCDYIEVE